MVVGGRDPGGAAVAAVDDQHPPPEASHVEGGGQAGGAGADDDGVQAFRAHARADDGRRVMGPPRPIDAPGGQGLHWNVGSPGPFPDGMTRDKPACSKIPAGPPGFVYRSDLIDPDEEAGAGATPWRGWTCGAFEMQGYVARRRVAYFGRRYDGVFERGLEHGTADPGLPAALRRKAAALAGLTPERPGPRPGQRISARRADRLASRQGGV
jgi:hypothetical protein